VHRSAAIGVFVVALVSLLPSTAAAQAHLNCAPVYEGQKAKVGASVQLEDGSYVTVTNPNVCMGESIQDAAAHASSAAGDNSTSASAVQGSNTTALGSEVAGAEQAAPQGAAATGLGGLADPTGLPALILLSGGLIAAIAGAIVARRRVA
jgi:hypothetical protein